MTANDSVLRSNSITGLVTGAFALGAFVTLSPALAADEINADPEVVLQEIVVTAERRTEKLQDVPAAIAVLQGDSLAAQGAQDYKDYLSTVPGVNYSEVGYRESRVVIRGVSDGLSTTDPLTGIYIDEAPVTQGASPTFDPSIYDIDRVEVLKGPQGTLYGAGSMGGTVRIITKKPQMNTFEGAVEATYGDIDHGGDLYRVDSVFNAPLVTDVAAVRIVGSYRNQDGFIDNIYPGDERRDINTVEKKNIRAQLLVKPESNTSVLLGFMYQDEALGGSDYSDVGLPRYEQSRAYHESGPSQARLASLTVIHEFSGATLTSATNYLDRNTTQDVDATSAFRGIVGFLTGAPLPPNDGLGIQTLEHFTVFSEEVRIQSSQPGPFQWLGGVFYSDQRSNSVQTFDPSQAPSLAAVFTGPQIYQDGSDYYTRQLAAFGELTYKFNERLSGTVGARVFNFKQHNVDNTDGLLNGGPSGDDVRSSASSETEKYLLDYKLTPDNHIYAQAEQGFRAGGPNSPVPQSICGADLAALGYATAPTQYQPDKLWNYEVGSKNTLLDNRLTVDGAAYYVDWNRIQSSIGLPTCLFGFTTNGGHAVSKGSELAVSVEPIRRWNVSASVSYTDAKLVTAAAGTGISSGDELPLVSKVSWNASTDYGLPVAAGLSATMHVDVTRVGSRWDEFASVSPYTREMPAYISTNLRFGVVAAHWAASIYATNLFDAYIVNYAAASASAPYNVLGLPRVIGVNARYSF
jgi:iron complex outermembrane receptor protein